MPGLVSLSENTRPMRGRRFFDIPDLQTNGLRDCQITAIHNLEDSFRRNQTKALIQMATGSGKTFTAITFIYRLLKYAKAKRVLFLVDTKNLGEQAEQEFMAYMPNDDNRKFTELYGVHRLKSSFVPTDNQVYISTIQRLYALLKNEELDETMEKKPGVPLKDLLAAITVGARDEALFTTLANRLNRLEKQLTDKEKAAFGEKANGKTMNQVAKGLLNAYNPDTLEDLRLKVEQEDRVLCPLRKKKN